MKEAFRFRGLRKDGKLIESNDMNDFLLQEFFWFEEIIEMTPGMYQNIRNLVKKPFQTS